MKRLLQISLDIFLTSICPIIIWIALGLIINKEISNVLIITYPLQFFYMIFTEIFSVGPNITDSKNNIITHCIFQYAIWNYPCSFNYDNINY